VTIVVRDVANEPVEEEPASGQAVLEQGETAGGDSESVSPNCLLGLLPLSLLGAVVGYRKA